MWSVKEAPEVREVFEDARDGGRELVGEVAEVPEPLEGRPRG